MNRDEFKMLALERLEDARALLKTKRFAAAYYLAGYAVECALKACIAKQTRQYDFPPRHAAQFYTHNLEDLLAKAGLRPELEKRRKKDSVLENYWIVVKDWTEESRYEARGKRKAMDLLRAIDDPRHGVLRFIKRYW